MSTRTQQKSLLATKITTTGVVVTDLLPYRIALCAGKGLISVVLLSLGLTYEEVLSFEPPVFDGDEMES